MPDTLLSIPPEASDSTSGPGHQSLESRGTHTSIAGSNQDDFDFPGTLLARRRFLKKSLLHLEELKANYGKKVPIDLKNEIDFHMREIEEIERTLAKIGFDSPELDA